MSVRAAFLSLLLLTLAHPAFAEEDEAARRAIAERVVAITTTDATMDAMLAAIWPPVRDNILAQNPSAPAEMLNALERVMADTVREMVTEMSSDVVAFYTAEFELTELEALEAFYRSETGVKVLALTPKLMNQVMPLMLRKSQAMMPKLMEEIGKAAKERGLKFDV